LISDELRVASDVKASDAQLDGDAQTVDERFILSHIVRGGKVKANHVLHVHLEGEMKTSPTPAPFFISDPSKYII
jgi:hypothetical protein